MYYNVAQLLKEPVGSTRTYSVQESIPVDESVTGTLIEGQLLLMRTDKGVWVTCTLDMSHQVTCSRCLSPCPYALSIHMEEEFLPLVDVHTGQSKRVPEQVEGAFTLTQHHGLDLTEPLRQYIITDLPMKPLCRQDCKGLCPDCGTNWNDTSCSCRGRAPDQRWASLFNLNSEAGG